MTPSRTLLLAASATVLLAGCGGGSTPTGAQGQAARISQAIASAAAAAPTVTSSDPETSSSAGSSSAGTTSTATVCQLLTAAQATMLNNITYDAAEATGGGDYKGCTYHNASQGVTGSEDLDVHVGTASDCWTEIQEGDGPGTPIAGLGDEAFGFAIGIAVRTGGTCIDFDGGTTAEIHGDWTSDTAMAKIILAGLG